MKATPDVVTSVVKASTTKADADQQVFFTALASMNHERIETTEKQLRELVGYEKELLKVRLEALDKALDVAAKELSRRLDVLNHAHEQSLTDRATFVNGQVYESNQKDWNKWRDEVNGQLNNAAGRSAVWASVSSVVVGFIVLLVSHFWK